MAFYPVLPDYFAIELGGGLPLLKASRILLLILMLCVCFHNKKIHLIRQPLKVTGLYWPLFIYFAARILANGYYAPSLSAAINTEFMPITRLKPEKVGKQQSIHGLLHSKYPLFLESYSCLFLSPR